MTTWEKDRSRVIEFVSLLSENFTWRGEKAIPDAVQEQMVEAYIAHGVSSAEGAKPLNDWAALNISQPTNGSAK